MSSASNVESDFCVMKRKRKYRCDACDFQTNRPKPLLLHVKEAHKPDLEIFSCELCNYASRTKYKVMQHNISAHSKRLEESVVNIDLSVNESDNDDANVGKGTDSDDFQTPRNSCSKPKVEMTKTTSARQVGADTVIDLVYDDDDETCKRNLLLRAKPVESVSNLKPESFTARKSCKKNEVRPRETETLNVKEKEKGKRMRVNPSKLIVAMFSKRTLDDGVKTQRRYQCQLCPFQGSHRFRVARHLQAVHKRESEYSCAKCSFVATSSTELTLHSHEHKRKRFRCDDCLFQTGSTKDFHDHRAYHMIIGAFKCGQCSFSSDHEPSVTSHSSKHHVRLDASYSSSSKKPSERQNTEEKLPTDNSLPPVLDKYAEDNQSCGTSSGTQKGFRCKTCQVVFSTRSEMSHHSATSHFKRRFVCTICHYRYKSSGSLKHHVRTKHGISLNDMSASTGKTTDAASLVSESILDVSSESVPLPKLELIDPKEMPMSIGDQKDVNDETGGRGGMERGCRSNVDRKSGTNNIPSVALSKVNLSLHRKVRPGMMTFKKWINKTDSSRRRKNPAGATAVLNSQTSSSVPIKIKFSHTIHGRFPCSLCDNDFKSKTALAFHTGKTHPHAVLYRCVFCPSGTLHPFNMRIHLRRHLKAQGKPYDVSVEDLLEKTFKPEMAGVAAGKCEFWTERDQGKTSMNIGENDDNSDYEMDANATEDIIFTGADALHSDKIDADATLEEDADNVVATAKNEKRQEIGSKTKTTQNPYERYRKWRCNVCSYVADCESKLASHREAHDDLKRFLCPICGLRSNWVLYVKRHLRKFHRTTKVDVVELSIDEARQTIAEYMKSATHPCHRMVARLKTTKKRGDRKELHETDCRVILESVKDDGKCELDVKDIPLLSSSQLRSEAAATNQSRRSPRQVHVVPEQQIEDSSGFVSNRKPLPPESVVAAASNVTKFKKYKCSSCGCRSNWSSALRRHVSVIHASEPARIITLSRAVAMATYEEYEYKLKKEISLFTHTVKRSGSIKAPFHQKKKNRYSMKGVYLKRFKTTDRLWACSDCGYRTKWRYNVRKHITKVHPSGRIVSANSTNHDTTPFKRKGASAPLKKRFEFSSETNDIFESGRGKSSSSAENVFPTSGPIPSVSRRSPFANSCKVFSPKIVGVTASSVSPRRTETPSSSARSSVERRRSYFKRPKNFACSGCSYTSQRNLLTLRHIESSHRNEHCHVVHILHARNDDKIPQNGHGIKKVVAETVRVDAPISDVLASSYSAAGDEVDDSERRRRGGGGRGRSIKWRRSGLNHDMTMNSYVKWKMFPCDICPYVAYRRAPVLKHKLMHTPKPGYTFKCTHCRYFAPSAYCLQMHERLHDAGDGDNAGTLPSDRNIEKNPLCDHAYSQNPTKLTVNKRSRYFKYVCDKCPYVTTNPQPFIYHKQHHHPRPSALFKCDVCPFWVSEKIKLTWHSKLHEKLSVQELEREGPLARSDSYSDEVVETARIKWDIVAAAQQSLPSVDAQDGRCTRNSASSSPRLARNPSSFTEMWLNGTLGSATPDVPGMSVTPFAEGQSEDDAGLVGGTDRNSATGEATSRSWHCEKCPYLTFSLIQFRRHALLHNGRQRYECEYCDYSVPRYYLLLQHKRLHLQPNQNIIFSQSIFSLQNLEGGSDAIATDVGATKENESLYENSLEFSAPSKAYRCSKCPYRTTRNKPLLAHQKYHTIRAEYQCIFCDYSVCEQRRLNIHITEHFNLPGCEMNAYSAANAATLLESMKEGILSVSRVNAAMHVKVSSDVQENEKLNDEIIPLTRKDDFQEDSISVSKADKSSVENETGTSLLSPEVLTETNVTAAEPTLHDASSSSEIQTTTITSENAPSAVDQSLDNNTNLNKSVTSAETTKPKESECLELDAVDRRADPDENKINNVSGPWICKYCGRCCKGTTQLKTHEDLHLIGYSFLQLVN